MGKIGGADIWGRNKRENGVRVEEKNLDIRPPLSVDRIGDLGIIETIFGSDHLVRYPVHHNPGVQLVLVVDREKIASEIFRDVTWGHCKKQVNTSGHILFQFTLRLNRVYVGTLQCMKVAFYYRAGNRSMHSPLE